MVLACEFLSHSGEVKHFKCISKYLCFLCGTWSYTAGCVVLLFLGFVFIIIFVVVVIFCPFDLCVVNFNHSKMKCLWFCHVFDNTARCLCFLEMRC